MKWRRPWLWLAAAGLVLWWAAVWLQLDATVLTRVPVLDEAHYLSRGAELADGRLPTETGFVMSPLYSILVAVTGSGRQLDPAGVLAGAAPWGLRIFQFFCWSWIVFLLWRAGQRMDLGRAAWIAPLLFVFYRPAAIYSGLVLLEIPLACTVLSFLYLITFSTRARNGLLGAAGAGALVGAATLLRGSTLLLLVPGWLALRGGAMGRRRVLVMTTTALLVLAPVLVFNLNAIGRLSGNAGLNLYIGNGPEATGLCVVFEGTNFTADPAGVDFLSDKLDRRVTDPGEADRIWTRLALDAMADDPVRALRLWLYKLRLHLVDMEISQVVPLVAFAREAPLLRPLAVPFGIITTLGLSGLALAAWRRRRLRPWLIALALLVGGQSLFFVVSRYRIVTVPIFCLLAGVGLHAARGFTGRHRVMAFVVFGLALLATRPWQMADIDNRWQALGRCNEALRWERLAPDDASATVRAMELYEEAEQIWPVQMMSYSGLARMQLVAGLRDAAIATLARGILTAESIAPLERELINLHLGNDRVDKALPRLVSYLQSHPDDPDMLHNYTIALSRTGRIEAALAAARHLVEVAPRDERGYSDLGVLLARTGRRDEARQVFRRGLQVLPVSETLRRNMAVLEGGQRGE